MRLTVVLLVSFLAATIAASLNYGDLLFVVLTQKHHYHSALSMQIEADLKKQASDLYGASKLKVITFNSKGSWTVLPILAKILKKINSDTKWVVFCDDHIVFKLENLINTLKVYDHNMEMWVGHSLKDTEPTVIHHYMFDDKGSSLVYPNFASGFAMTIPLVKKANQHYTLNKIPFLTDFSIDPAFELSLYIWNNATGPVLTHSPHLCVVNFNMCATYPGTYTACKGPVDLESIFFAVKTCQKFHKDRVPVVKKTWGAYASNIMYFSDLEDSDIPTVDIGVPNTDKGHCEKSIAILSYLNKHLEKYPSVNWVVLADDDTILSVSRMCELVSCYGVKQIALGERYGYRLLNGSGYDYLTGGGGIVFSRDVVAELTNCTCPSISSPDDMWIGVCLAKLKIPLIHSPLFHQGRPIDYSLEHLAPHRPVSFHRHWMVDPIDIYEKWFKKDDVDFINRIVAKNLQHNEL